MSDLHREIHLEGEICSHLAASGWLYDASAAGRYDRARALFPEDLHVLKGKLLESETLAQQAASNTKEQFANSPDLSQEILNAIMDALTAHQSMSRQALDSEKVQRGLREILLGPAQLYEALMERAL